MPGMPSVRSDWQRTGRTKHRRSWRGRFILMLEETCRTGRATGAEPRWAGFMSRWRDARDADFEVIEGERRVA